MEYDCTADDMTDEEIARLCLMNDEVREMLKPDFIQEYVAKYIQALYKYEFAQRKTSALRNHINSCIEDFNCINYKDINLKKVNQILKDKYQLRIIKEEPYLELEEI